MPSKGNGIHSIEFGTSNCIRRLAWKRLQEEPSENRGTGMVEGEREEATHTGQVHGAWWCVVGAGVWGWLDGAGGEEG